MDGGKEMKTGALMIEARETFCAAHRLHSPYFSDAENKEIYDKCNNFHGHGHNYVLYVVVKSPVDPKTGMVMNFTKMKEIIRRYVVDVVDHKNINMDIPDFKDKIPTAEVMVLQFWEWLEPHFPEGLLYEIRLAETEKNVVIYRGE